jgi:hypothetical protein
MKAIPLHVCNFDKSDELFDEEEDDLRGELLPIEAVSEDDVLGACE